MKVLYGYRYGVVGGVCTQIRNRLDWIDAHQTDLRCDLLFAEDYGASAMFEPRHQVHVTKDVARVAEIMSSYDIVAIIDTPEYLTAVKKSAVKRAILEVHTTTTNIQYLADVSKDADLLKRLACIIVPSEYMKKRIAKDFGLGEAHNVIVTPNCLNVSLFKDKGGLPEVDGKWIVLWVGKLDDHKNWRGLLEIAKRVRVKRGDGEFLLVGGRTGPEKVVQELIEMLDRYGLMDFVKWLPFVQYAHMRDLYALARASGGCHLITSISESFGMSMAEALAMGCPVIASRVGALPEVLDGFGSQALYELGNYDEAAERVVAHLSNPDSLGNVVAQRREAFRDRVSVENVGRQYFDELRKIGSLAN